MGKYPSSNETQRQAEAFDYYYTLGDDRNYTKVAEKYGVSKQAVRGWALKFNWDSRINERERKLIDEMFARTDDNLVSIIKQLFKINDELLYKFLIDLKNNKIKINTVSEYYKLADLMIRIASLRDSVNSDDIEYDPVTNTSLIQLEKDMMDAIKFYGENKE